MKKRASKLLSTLLVLCMVLALLPSAALAAEPTSGTFGDTLTWKFDADGTLTIGGTGIMPDFDSSSMPWIRQRNEITAAVIGSGVTSIGKNAFYRFSNLTSVTIPSGVTSIGADAFYNCTNLTSVKIPSGVTSIGGWAFYNCSALETVDIPGSVATIGDRAFMNCGALETVTIRNGVTSIGESAFSGCNNLTSVTIPDSVTSIGETAFNHCESLTSVDIPGSVATIGESAFSNCSALKTVTVQNGVTSIGKDMFSSCKSLRSVTIPVSVTSIEIGAFSYCVNFQDVYYGGSFSQWKNITFGIANEYLLGVPIQYNSAGPDDDDDYGEGGVTWSYSDGVLTIGGRGPMDNYFVNLKGDDSSYDRLPPWYDYHTEIHTVIIGNGVTRIGNRAFSDCSNLTSVTISNRALSIGEYAFYNCSSLTSVTIPINVRIIAYNAFDGCGLTGSLIIPDSVTSIGSSAFRGCEKLTDVTISKYVAAISGFAFAYCDNLTSVAIPDSITSIETAAFIGCSSLTDVYYSGSESQWEQIEIDVRQNEMLLGATIHYNSTMPDTPSAPSTPKVQLSDQKLTVDGVKKDCEKYNIGGSNYFKLRDLAYMLSGTGSQFEVGYDFPSNTVTIDTGKTYTPNGSEMVIGEDKSGTAKPTDQTVMIDGVVVDKTVLSIYNIGGNNYFKLRDLGDALGFEVDYDFPSDTAIVRSR